MTNKILIFLLLSFSFFATNKANDNNKNIIEDKKSYPVSSIWQEINKFKQTPEIKQQLKIKNSFLKEIAGLIETVNVANSKDGLLNQALSHFFLNIFPGGIIRSSSKDGLVLLTPEKTPELFEVINSLCEKMSLPIPVVMLSGDKKMFNAFATSLSTDLSMVVIGQGLLKKLSNDELRSVLAHELGHIKHYHPSSQIGIALTCSVVLPLLIKYLVLNMETGETIIKSSNQSSLVKFFQSSSGTFVLFSVFSALTTILLISRGRVLEKEADITALETTDDTQAFISMMEKIEEYTRCKKEKFEKSYQFVFNKLDELEKESPLIAKFLKWRTNSYKEEFIRSFDDTIDGENGTHPSCKHRKEYAQEYEKNKHQSKTSQS